MSYFRSGYFDLPCLALLIKINMDESSFTKELNKYKVIRSADYCRPRSTKNKVELKNVSNTLEKRNKNIDSVAVEEKGPINSDNFWEIFSAANCSILTAAESIKFIEALKQEHDTIKNKVNLYDLEQIASCL